MKVTNETLARLREPFPSSAINWRVGRASRERLLGQALPYLDARTIQSRLDDIVGAENWQVEYKSSPLPNGLICRLGILVGDAWVFKEDGAQLDDVGAENNHEMAIKGAYTDAFKRAAVMWGIGRYLYDYDAPWVNIEIRGKKLVFAQEPPVLPAHMRPAGEPEPVRSTSASAVVTERPAAETAGNAPSSATAAKTVEAPTQAPSEAKAEEPPQAKPASVTQAPQRTASAPSESPAASNPRVATNEVARPAPSENRSAQAPAMPSTATAGSNASGRSVPNTRPTPTQSTVRPQASASGALPATAAKAAPQAPSQAASAADDMPEGLTEEERKIVKGLLDKIAKPSIPLAMLENYIEGPKVSSVLSASAKQFVQNRMSKRRLSDANA